MAEKTLDLTKTVGELLAEDQGLSDVLHELGFDDLPEDKTIGELADGADIDLGVIAFALEASGYDVTGYKHPDDGFENPLPDMVHALFEGTYKGEKLPDTSGSDSPMLAHMEMAIRRAKSEGRL